MELIIRTDADSKIGIGHFMRCLAMAQEWKSRGGTVKFVTGCSNTEILGRLNHEGFQIIQLEHPYPDQDDWAKTSQLLEEHQKTWVVLDGYHFDQSYHRRIKGTGHQLLVIDDMAHLDHYYADVVLNQNIHAKKLDYSCEPYTRLLLGTRYALLRNEFWTWCSWKREIPDIARKVLVTLGGADPNNQTLKVIRALQRVKVDKIETAIVVGASNSHFSEIKTAIGHSPQTTSLFRNPSDMPALMAWADVAVTAGGSTSWEMAFMGLPNILIVLAQNQQGIADGLAEAGIGINLGWFEKVSEDLISRALTKLIYDNNLRQQMSQEGRWLVDNFGKDRVFSELLI